MATFLHWLAHLTGWNYGLPVSKRDDSGQLWLGFECGTCGKVSCIHKSKEQ